MSDEKEVRLILCSFLVLLCLFMPFSSSYAKMKSAVDSQAEQTEQRALFKKYSGIPVKGHLIEDVPFYKQKKRNYCGPAVLSMVLNYWDKTGSFAQEKIASDIFDLTVEITNNSEMVFYPYNQNFHVLSFNGNMEDLKSLVRKNIPIIILQKVVDKIINKGHYRVVVGYDDAKNVMILNDPWFGNKLSMSCKRFSELWDFGEEINKKNWALIILPKEKDIINKIEIKESAVTYHNIATALYSREKLPEAIQEWHKALSLSPKEITFYYCISYAYIQQGGYDAAIRYGESAVELSGDNAFAHDTLGWAYYKKGMLNDALLELEKAIQLNPDTDFIKNHYSIVKEKVDLNE